MSSNRKSRSGKRYEPYEQNEEKWYRLEAKRNGSPCWFIACETKNKHKLRRKYNKLIERGFVCEVKVF